MKVSTLHHAAGGGWRFDGERIEDPQLVIWFGGYQRMQAPEAFDGLRALFPNAHIAGCSTNGEIYNGEVLDGGLVAAAMRFEATGIKAVKADIGSGDDARAAGRDLAGRLVTPGLKGVYVLADAFRFNGANLIEGMIEALPEGMIVAGGMAGDDGRLGGSTFAGLDATPGDGVAVAIGFYGDQVRITQGVAGGWDPLGPVRLVTRSDGPFVFELDGEPALELYERLVGDAATNARLRHPFVFKSEVDSQQDVIREVVDIDRERGALVFIDSVPQGWWGQMLRGVDDHLVDGAALAARRAGMGQGHGEALGLVVSCIGRKWVMGQRIGDETEAVQEESPGTPTIGFFSYGEVAPHERTGRCTLHHASVSVTLLSEAA